MSMIHWTFQPASTVELATLGKGLNCAESDDCLRYEVAMFLSHSLDVTVVVLGQKGVGKMTFIAHCLVSCSCSTILLLDLPIYGCYGTLQGLPQEAMSQTMQQAVNICGWDVRIKMVIYLSTTL